MNAVPLSDILDAAAYALVSERCRRAYLHDVRNGLHVLHNALELLARSAKTPGESPELVQKFTALARRAISNHEHALTELLQRLTPQDETPISINVGEVVRDVLRFLGNEASSKSIAFRLATAPDVCILAQPGKCRLLILGLCVLTIDELAAGAVLDISVGRSKSDALIEFNSNMPGPATFGPQDLWRSMPATLTPYELLLAITSRWAFTNGGRLELPTESLMRGALRIYFPESSIPLARPDRKALRAAAIIEDPVEDPL